MSETRLIHHVGILVASLDQAIDDFSEQLGVSFPSPRDRPIEIEMDGQRSLHRLRYAYSAEGPPFIELIEATDHGIWASDTGEGFHHLCFLQPALDARLDELTACRRAVEAVARRDGSAYVAYLPPEQLHGVRVELVDAARARDATALTDGLPPASTPT